MLKRELNKMNHNEDEDMEHVGVRGWGRGLRKMRSGKSRPVRRLTKGQERRYVSYVDH
jgi:hypothetical protein